MDVEGKEEQREKIEKRHDFVVEWSKQVSKVTFSKGRSGRLFELFRFALQRERWVPWMMCL